MRILLRTIAALGAGVLLFGVGYGWRDIQEGNLPSARSLAALMGASSSNAVPTPEQIAPFVVYLASDESSAVTGTVFPVDAGYMAFKAQVDVMGTMQSGY